jgi:hypothetical protein
MNSFDFPKSGLLAVLQCVSAIERLLRTNTDRWPRQDSPDRNNPARGVGETIPTKTIYITGQTVQIQDSGELQVAQVHDGANFRVKVTSD